MAAPLSVLILAKNEEKNLPRCLETLKGKVAETIVLDTGSTDHTISLARRFGAKVIEQPFRKNFSHLRNFLIEAAKSPWILFLDADQRLARRDLKKIFSAIKDPQAQIYRMSERHYSDWRLLEGWNPCKGEYEAEEKLSNCAGYFSTSRLLLFRKLEGLRFTSAVHETLLPAIEKHGLCLKNLDVSIHHYGYAVAPQALREKHLRYLEIMKEAIPRAKGCPTLFKHLLVSWIKDSLFTASHLKEARRHAMELTRHDPNEMKYWQLRGHLALFERRFSDAERSLLKAILLKPTSDAYCMLGWLHLERRDSWKAVKALKRALQLNMSNPLAWNLLGVSHSGRGFDRKALLAFDRALAIHPNYEDALLNRSAHHLSKGRQFLSAKDASLARAKFQSPSERLVNLEAEIRLAA